MSWKLPTRSAPMPAVFRFGSLKLDEDRFGAVGIGGNLGVRAASRCRVLHRSDTGGAGATCGRRRAFCGAVVGLAVRALRLDPSRFEAEDDGVAEVPVDKRVSGTADLLPHDDSVVFEEFG